MRLLLTIPRTISRPASLLVVALWAVQMGVLFHRTYLLPSTAFAADLARYGSGAQWKGVYYKGAKIGFMVGQTLPVEDGFELQEDGRLQMTLLGATTAARIKTLARVDKDFSLRSFRFSLDPGTGAIEVAGNVEGNRLSLDVKTPSSTRHETRELAEHPSLSLNLPRQLAAAGLKPGMHRSIASFDPATLRNAPMSIDVEAREVVWAAGRPVPAFRVLTRFAGVTSTSWVTDVGEVVKEESPMGLMVLRETQERATALAVPGDVQTDLLEAAAVVPTPSKRIDDPMSVDLLRVQLEGLGELGGPDLQGAGQTVTGDVFEMRPSALAPEPADPDASRFVAPEVFIESDAPEILAEARKAVGALSEPRARAERLTRHVNALIEKKPTVSLPSALEVLRTRVGDCNEHTALYVALARSLGIPSRIAVGLVHVQGAFYYHAWPEVYLEGPPGRGLWLAADPTLNQFPADATHIRLSRGGLEKQAALTQVMGRLKMRILELRLRPGSNPLLVGRAAQDTRPMDFALPKRDGAGQFCWSRPN
jgi:hypothetical protein